MYMMGEGTEKNIYFFFFSAPFSVVCVSGILAGFVLALAHLKNAKN